MIGDFYPTAQDVTGGFARIGRALRSTPTMEKPMSELKKTTPPTAFTPEEKLRVAFAHICLGVDQHTLSAMYGINPGRVAEAVNAVRSALTKKEPTA